MTPEQRIARIARLVSAARALLSLETGIVIGARRVKNSLNSLGEDFENSHVIFGDFIKSIPLDIPFGSARLLMEKDYLIKTDNVLENIEAKYRSLLLLECAEIIEKYG